MEKENINIEELKSRLKEELNKQLIPGISIFQSKIPNIEKDMKEHTNKIVNEIFEKTLGKETTGEYYVYECPHCKEILSTEIMGQKCTKCREWTYTHECKRKKTLSDKIFDNPNDDEMVLLKDVKEHLKKFIDFFNETTLREDIKQKAKEIFGERLLS